jgi:ribosome-binding protein aMBF1 (putative translation factor)
VGTGGDYPNFRATRLQMAANFSRHQAYAYAERIRERLPRRMQELREAQGLSRYALWRRCGLSRNTISRIEAGDRLPGVAVLAQLAAGMGVSLEGFIGGLEDGPKAS